MKVPKRLKRKLAPERTSDISSDEVLFIDDEIMITRFMCENSKMGSVENLAYFDFKRGYSVIEKFDKDGKFMYWYCDILEFEHNTEKNSILITDLIADVVVYKDQFVATIDLDELADAFENKEITSDQLIKCLRHLHNLNEDRWSGKFPPEQMKPYSKLDK